MQNSPLRLTAIAIAVALYAQASVAQEVVAQATTPESRPSAPGEGQEGKPELPLSKEVTSGQALQQARDGYSDVARRQASVTEASPAGNSAPLFNIRGIRVNPQSNFRLDGGVAVTSVQSMPTEDKERIETLKGANALMFGIASPSGIINMIPKRAGERDVTTLSINGNHWGQLMGHVDVGRRFGDQKQVGIRVNVSTIRVRNGVDDLSGEGGFGSVGWDVRVNSRLTVQGDVEYYERHTSEQAQIQHAPAVNGVVPVTRVPDPTRNLLGPGGDWAIYSPRSLNYQFRADYAITKDWKVLAQAGRSDAHRHRHAVRIQGYDLNTGANGRLVDTITSNNNINTFYRVEASGTFLTGAFTHQLTAGVSKSERYSESEALNLTLPQQQNIFDPTTVIPRPIERAGTPNLNQNSVDQAVYVYDTVGLTRSLKLLAGVRYTQNTDSIQTRPDTKSNATSPALGVLYDLRPTTQVYASYMSGLEAGTVAPGTAANANFVLAAAESKQKEIGIRDTSIAGLLVNAAYFDIKRKNAVLDPITNVYGYNGDVKYRGVEANANYTFLGNWLANAGFQYLDVVQNTPSTPLLNGKIPENTPRWTGTFGLGHRPTWLPGLQVRVGARTTSSRAMNPQNTGHIPGFTLFDLGVSYATQIMGKRTQFQVSVDNVANKRYWNSVANGQYGIGMDRTLRFGARVEL